MHDTYQNSNKSAAQVIPAFSDFSSVITLSCVLHKCFKYAITCLSCNVMSQASKPDLSVKTSFNYPEHSSPKQNGHFYNKVERRIQMSKKVMLTKEFQCDFHIMECVQTYPILFIYLFQISLWSLLITCGKLHEIKGLGKNKQHHCPHNFSLFQRKDVGELL